MNKKITKEDVVHVARLSRIVVDGDDVEKYQKDLGAILEYVEMLNEVDTNHIEPLFQVNEQENVMSEDVIEEWLNREAVLELAKYKDLVNFKTKGVFDNE